MAIIQASTVLSLAEKVNVVAFKLLLLLTFNESFRMMFFWQKFYSKSTSSGVLGSIRVFAFCRPLVDPANRGNRSGAAPEDDGP